MEKTGNMTLRTRLFAGFGLVVLAMFIVVGFCLNTSRIARDVFEEIQGDIAPGTIAMSDMESYAHQVRLLAMRHASPGRLERSQLPATTKKLAEAGRDRLEREVRAGSNRETTAKELLRKIEAVNSVAMDVAALETQGASVDELAAKAGNEFHPLIQDLLDQINEQKAVYVVRLAAAQEAVHNAHVRTSQYGLLAAAFVALLAVGVVLTVTSSTAESSETLYGDNEAVKSESLDGKAGAWAGDEIVRYSQMFDQITQHSEMVDTPQSMINAPAEQVPAGDQRLEREIARCERVQEALDASTREFKDFVHVASHDLREPLRKISSFGLLLKESLEGKLEDEDRENLEFMVDGAKRMTRMIEDLLTYSRLNAKVIKPEMVDLNQVVEQLEGIELAALLEETGTAIEVPQLLPKVQADPALVKTLLQNLIVNGIEYSGKDVQPQILIRVGQIADDEITIGVQDEGIGIDEKFHEHIFRIFTRLRPREEGEGTGTGLAICKKILDKHGGRLEVDSHVDTGSTFWFTLPAARSLEQEQDRLVSSAST